ncbi:MAG: DNA/RNA non-specific endonuclease [Lachnospiraceae bacterium]|nr:DNA/RNA non-specific endonuclease [Lachnospiraceae bacterium]
MTKNLKKCLGAIACFLVISMLLSGCSVISSQSGSSVTGNMVIQLADIPEYAGEPYVVMNDNVPQFSEDDITDQSFEKYGELDHLKRCGFAVASIGQDLMPTGKRGTIGQIKPSGWQTVKYDMVDGKYLYNRCHLIGYQLTAENANERNLITGTRYMNVEGMLPFENMVADYIKETDNHVMYRVTPIFEGNNLVASGIQMEAYSVEDSGDGISYNVFVYNVQPGIEIDYKTGESRLEKSGRNVVTEQAEIRGNSRSKIYHCPGQAAYNDMADSKNLVVFSSEEEAQAAGYRKAKR